MIRLLSNKSCFILLLCTVASFSITPTIAQTLTTNETHTVDGLSFYSEKIVTTNSNVKIHVKFSCQSCAITFIIADEANYTAWQNGTASAQGIIRSNQTSLDETFTLGKQGNWYLTWENNASFNKTILIQDISFSSGDQLGLIIISIVLIGSTIGVSFYLKNRFIKKMVAKLPAEKDQPKTKISLSDK